MKKFSSTLTHLQTKMRLWQSIFNSFWQKRIALLRWAGWFTLANASLLWLIGIPYLLMLFPLEVPLHMAIGNSLVILFIFISYFGYFSFIATLSLWLPTLLFSTFSARATKTLRIAIATIATLLIVIIFVDTFVFSHYRFHLNSLILHMIFSGKAGIIFGFSSLEWLLIFVVLSVFFLVEILLSQLIWRYINCQHRWFKHGKMITLILGSFLLGSYTTYISSAALGLNAFTQQTKVLPLYEYTLAMLLPFKNIRQTIENYAYGEFSQLRQVREKVHYPLQPLNCGRKPTAPYNILFIIIDGWRFDALSKELTPALMQFAQNSWQFTHHFSGGNSSQAGLFSLMYSLPSNYWTAMREQQVSPVFTQQLRKQNYQLATFASKPMDLPPFNQTIFLDMHKIVDDLPAETSGERDQQLTKEALHWMKQQQNEQQPFFAFLFYDSGHSYCAEQTYPQRLQPAINQCYRMSLSQNTDPLPYHNRYRNAILFLDNEIDRLLAELRRSQILENTIIVITGDHGQEFNDSKQNYWEHASNYTRFQVQTPLIISWPKQTPKLFNYTTTHYDVVPTLLSKLFSCQTPTENYSIGDDLLKEKKREYIIAGSYINFAVIEPHQITTIYPSGTIEKQDTHAKPLPQNMTTTLTGNENKNLTEVLGLMRKFYEKKS